LNRSYTTTDKNEAHPKRDLVASLIDMYGDISNKEAGRFLEERYEVGPLPILRPKRIMSFSYIPTT
jgi:hypothetical protein